MNIALLGWPIFFFRKGQELESKWLILTELDDFFLTKLSDHAWILNLRLHKQIQYPNFILKSFSISR